MLLTNELAGTLAQGPRKSRKQTMRDTHCSPYAQFFLCEPDCNRSGICEYTTGRMPEIRGVISVYDFSSPRPPIHWRFFSSQTKGKQKVRLNIQAIAGTANKKRGGAPFFIPPVFQRTLLCGECHC